MLFAESGIFNFLECLDKDLFEVVIHLLGPGVTSLPPESDVRDFSHITDSDMGDLLASR